MAKELREILEEINIDMMESLLPYGFAVFGAPEGPTLYANALLIEMLGYDSLESLCTAESEGTKWDGDGEPGREDIRLLRRKDGKLCRVKRLSSRKALKDGREVVVAAYLDEEQAGRQQKMSLEKAKLEADRQAQRAERKLRVAMENSSLAVWECIFAERKNIYTDETVRNYHLPKVMENVPEGLIASGFVHPESEELLRDMYRAVMGGQPHAEGTVATLRGREMRWLRIRMTTLYDELGRPESAICTAEDITREKTLLQQMEDELARRSAYETNLRAKGYCDLTEDRILEYSSKGKEGEIPAETQRYSELVDVVARQIPNRKERSRFRSLFALSNLSRRFESGNGDARLEYGRLFPGEDLVWVDTRVHVMRQPGSGHLVLFLYTTDINEQKQTQAVLSAIATDNYDGIILISLADSSYRSFTQRERKVLSLPMEGKNYWRDLDDSLKKCLSEEDYREVLKTRNQAYIQAYLEQNPRCIFVSTLTGDGGQKKIMKMQYSYLDARRQHLIATGMDITSAVQEEKQQKEALESALLAAKQASSAKTSFLSRMSHEIRTPLNAILGMTALAAQANGNEDEIRDCIAKIGISGHYLLNLINDILDMSRIESGKMLLRNEPFNFADFIENITTVIYGQTEQKGISYETVVAHGLEDGYIGDAMKLQQVLVNILGNAVKFTDKGGKITFSVSLASQDKHNATLRFAVNDTGCGIAEEALTRIFEPFEQQDGSTTSVYGGTGLGLAISKNLVQLMGGTIRVRSIVDVGSEFTVEVPLAIDPTLVKKHPERYSFADLKTLIVDDDILVCEQTSKTLEDIGMIPEWVTSGESAIARVSELWEKKQNFDFILVDWKMPDMDGIETSRRIRRIVGPDVTIIIITAYDWAAIETEARAAGVNMCISKPMLRSTLVSAFTKATGEAEHDRLAKAEPEFDFTGRRILLAEDHPLNAEIATRLLAKKHCDVDLAENGLKALERFTTAPVGYYDAILMDIRMPIMDGLQAANNIRHWDKADAKTIPIVAMTANAFDEDVDKSKAVGMDAHLAKPIDAQLLYKVLYRLMQ
ncbi:MAG: response regulator [Oscillospiraceae bacterium]|nr:response regulator [Oscillospiraceae bacterium]